MAVLRLTQQRARFGARGGTACARGLGVVSRAYDVNDSDKWSDDDSSPSSEDEDDQCTDCCDIICCSSETRYRPVPICLAFFAACLLCWAAGVFLVWLLRSDSSANNLSLRSNSDGSLGTPLRSFNSSPTSVDVVFLWVNGSHPQFKRELENAQRNGTLPYTPHSARFREDGLLQYAVLYLLSNDKLMASVRHVYILTSGEMPT